MTGQVKVSPELVRASLSQVFGDMVEFDKPLAPLTTYGTGGPAQYFLAARKVEYLCQAVKFAKDKDVPLFVMGGGSNLLVSDAGFKGLVVKVEINGIRLEPDSCVRCGAGEDLMSLVDYATANSLSGLEFAAGIWGTVGGAIYGNAGAFGGEMKDVLKTMTIVDLDGNIRTVNVADCRFGYRDSFLKATGEVVVEASFRLSPGDKSSIENRISEILAAREDRHPTQGKSAGCFFKNIPDPDQEHGKLPAGRLLEQAGVKGLSIGGAAVYEKHANMIVNTGNATSKDIRQLADIMKEHVQSKFGIVLEEEVIQVGEF